MHGAVQPTAFPRGQVPDSIKTYFPSEGDHVLVSGLYTNSENPQAREAAYRLFLYPSERQEELLSDLLKCRHVLAKTCGFETYAHRALNASTVEHPQMVKEFIDELSNELRPRADADFRLMEKMKRKDSGNPQATLQAWDTPYFTSQMKRNALNASANEFLPYFSLGGCMQGLDNLMQSLYGISLQNTEMEPGESWHNDIYKLSVVHEKEGLLGYIYCDFFERNNKPNQDCHFTIQGGKRLPDGSYQLPIVVAWQLRFSHLVGYGAKYYSYLISKTIASWIWQTYFEKNPFNREAGEKYRQEVLAHGGGVPSRQLVANFLKRDLTPQNLAHSLIHEIDDNNDKIKDMLTMES
ncbi:hypothetical protein DOY81_009559 [Sarcophaga bullata]|nr:hypothetical protein DOY81_009559 [Sarcophaga bullata]